MLLLFFCHIFQSLNFFFFFLNVVALQFSSSDSCLYSIKKYRHRWCCTHCCSLTAKFPAGSVQVHPGQGQCSLLPFFKWGFYKYSRLLNARPAVHGDESARGSPQARTDNLPNPFCTAFQISVGVDFLSVPPGCLPFLLLCHPLPSFTLFSMSSLI